MCWCCISRYHTDDRTVFCGVPIGSARGGASISFAAAFRDDRADDDEPLDGRLFPPAVMSLCRVQSSMSKEQFSESSNVYYVCVRRNGGAVAKLLDKASIIVNTAKWYT